MIRRGDDHIKEKLKEKAPEKSSEIEKMTFGEIKEYVESSSPLYTTSSNVRSRLEIVKLKASSLRQSIVDDMKILEANPFLKHLKVLGYIYDITHGHVEEVKID